MYKTAKKSGAQILKERLQKPGIIIAPGAYDCLSARLVEQCGFEAAFMTGYGASASILGEPDYGLMTMNEMANVCANMNAFLNIPLIGDIDIWKIRCSPNAADIWRTRRSFLWRSMLKRSGLP